MDKMELAKAEISKMKVQIVIVLEFALVFFLVGPLIEIQPWEECWEIKAVM